MRMPEKLSAWKLQCQDFLIGPQALAFLPAISLAAFWLFGQTGLVTTALAAPLFWAVLGGSFGRSLPTENEQIFAENIDIRTAIDQILGRSVTPAEKALCAQIDIDDYAELSKSLTNNQADILAKSVQSRLRSILRSGDICEKIAPGKFVLFLKAAPALDLEACIKLAARIQDILDPSFDIDGSPTYVTASVGLCPGFMLRNPNLPNATDRFLSGAACAVQVASVNGPSASRVFSPDMKSNGTPYVISDNEAVQALEIGEIIPWFQPQISTDTGRVTGFEALARWDHPERGILPPAEFMPALESAQALEKLCDHITRHSLSALKAWRAAGHCIEHVGVNFSADELRNPALVNKISWELDRLELTHDALAVEVLETVITGRPDDIITHNINALAQLGCLIDLDDFGTGNASISSLRQLKVSRLKIDRSFIKKADLDPEQQKMVSTIVMMADRLDLACLAEGVETHGEHTIVAQLGCSYVQGFGIARPMPFVETLDWLGQHTASIKAMPEIRRKLH